MKFVFIGGHHNSALQVAKILKKRGNSIFWFGHKHTMRGEKSLSAEYLEIKKEEIPFYEIKTSKFYHSYNPFLWLKIFKGFGQSLVLLKKLKPDLIVSFGGYLSVPVVLAGFILKIPAVCHEQTTQAGMANQLLSRLAKKVFLTWPSSKKYFPAKKTILIGLPLNKNFFNPSKKKVFPNNLKTILIVGGKQGSHLLNNLVKKNLFYFLSHYNLIHQCGRIIKTKDWPALRRQKSLLPAKLKSRYLLKPYFFQKEMAEYLKAADLVISRAGAHIIYELLALAKPAILIPISWSYKREQEKNAQMLKKLGTAVVLAETTVTPIKLRKTVINFFKNLKKFQKNARKAQKKAVPNAAEKMAAILENFYSNRKKNQ